MVDLNNASGIPLLAAMYLAGEDSTGRKFTGGLNGKNLLAGSFGASSAQYLGSQVNGKLGMNMSSELAQALAAAGTSYAGERFDMDEWTDPIAAGVLYNVGRQSFNEAGLDLGSLASGVGIGGGSQNTGAVTQNQANQSPTQRDMTAQSSGRRF